MRGVMEVSSSHHHHHPVRSPSSEGDSGTDDDDSNSVLSHARRQRPMFPIPHSHWFPRPISFRAYAAPRVVRQQGASNGLRLHIQVTRPLAYKLTKDIVGTYQSCNSNFQYLPDCNPKRSLTQPSTAVSNNGLDNEKHDLILYVNQVLVNDDGTRRYVVKDLVGSGTFGQVAKCYTEETNDYVAVKVIKNQPAYYTQAKFEIGILHMLNKEWDPQDKYHIVRSLDHFKFHGHLCIVFELLTVNLYELLRTNSLKGLSLMLVRMFTKQLLESLSLLRDARVIHCDLKPENILLTRSSFQAAEIKLIDFGSACKEDQTVYTYIQSRFYRSPEVLLGHPYTTAIDMWSLGCVAAELFLGLPLFPGACEYDLLLFIKEKLGTQPPDYILRNAKYTNKFFKLLTAAPHSDQSHTAYQILTAEEYEVRQGKKPDIGRRYFSGALAEMIMGYHMRPMSQAEQEKELHARETFVDFLRGLIECDPRKRWTPQQAAQHPFVTEEPYYGPYVPVPETPRTPVHQGLLMEHRGIAGHWFCAGLSPQVGNLSLGSRFNGSPQQHPTHFSLASSYGSIGSLGSYGEGGSTFDSNFESHIDGPGVYPIGVNNQASNLGGSPESSWRGRPLVPSIQGVAHTQLGMSPSSAGGFRSSMALGASPSQFSTQGPHFQMSPGSYVASPGSFPSSPASSGFLLSPGSPSQQGSPNRFGPTSPARGSGGRLREQAVGNANAAHGHHYPHGHRRRQFQGQVPPPASGHAPMAQDFPQWQKLQHNNASGNMEASSSGVSDGQGGLRRGAPPMPHSRTGGTGGTGSTAGVAQQSRSSYPPGTLGSFLSPDSSMDGADEDSLIGPHWDPNFSDDLLQEDAIESGARRNMTPDGGIGGEGGHVMGGGPGPSFSVPSGGVDTSLAIGRTYSSSQGGTSDGTASMRTSHGQASTSTSVEGSPVSSHSSQSGYPRQKHGYYSPNQTSPSRLGPQCSQSLQQQQRHQPGHHPHPHSQQISPEQTPLHPHHGGRRHLSGEVSTSVPPGTLPFQQRQQNYQLQQQQYHQQQYRSPQPSPDLQLAGPGRGNPNGEAGNSLQGGLLPSPQRDNRLAYFGVNHNTLAGNAITPRMQGGQPEQEGNALSAAGFAIAAGMGHPLHQVQYQQYNGGEQQWPGPGGILPQNFFVNDLFSNMGRRSGPHLIGVRPPTAPARR